jgi:glycosyltransferase involved in cell wall biosynthesis
MSEIDIILPTYNQCYFLDRAIPPILDQEFRDFTLIIVNDGSTDGTYGKLHDSYEGRDPRIKIIDLKPNRGLPAALNVGHGEGNSPYCTWISTDNISYKNQFKVLYDFIKSDDYDFVQSRWYVKRGNETIPTTILNCKDNWGYANLCPSFLYKRIVWEKYHYDENMLCCEDLKFYLQAYIHPFKFGHTDEFLMEYYVQPNSLTFRGNPKRGHREMLNEIYRTVIKPHEERNH